MVQWSSLESEVRLVNFLHTQRKFAKSDDLDQKYFI